MARHLALYFHCRLSVYLQRVSPLTCSGDYDDPSEYAEQSVLLCGSEHLFRLAAGALIADAALKAMATVRRAVRRSININSILAKVARPWLAL